MENAYVLQLSDSKFKDLFLCFCGYAQCYPYHSFGPAIRPNYIIHFILNGKGTYQAEESKYKLSSGTGFLIEPETSTFYMADGTEPWDYLWVGFGGTRAGEFVRDLGLNGNQLTFRSEKGSELKNLVLKMLKSDGTALKDQYLREALLYEFFSLLAEDHTVGEIGETAFQNTYISLAVNYIRNHYSADIKIADVAKELCVDRSYLYKLFQSNLQMSPQQFLTNFRVSRSKELLMTTKRSIEEISVSCGYKDPRAFSRIFKKKTGCLPTVYRKERQKETDKKRSELNSYQETFGE